jgi:esterase/lipase superfamily enzyme
MPRLDRIEGLSVMRVNSSSRPTPRFGPSRLVGLTAALVFAAAVAGCAGSLGDMTGAVVSAGGLFAGAPKGPSLPIPMFVASTRRDDAPAADGEDGAHFALDIVSVPPGHRAGVIETPTFGGPQEGRDFVLTSERALEPDEFGNAIATSISGRIGSNRDILLYVHGFNTSLQDARFRLAQVVADGRFGGVPVLFTWPSQNSLFSYVSDKERATASRDALEKLMWNLSQVPGIGRIHVLAHSMGTWLAMEALRENAIAGHPDLDGKLGDVMLAAPDIDLAVFQQQMARLGEAAHVSIFVSAADRALSLSSRLAGDRPRVGALDPHDARDRAELEQLGVKVYDLSSFADGFVGHDAYADLPQVVRTIGAQLAEPRKEDAKVMALTDAGADRRPAEVAPAIVATPLPPPTTAAPASGQGPGM